MDDFRKTFKEANPDSKDVKRVGKEGGEKWRSMTDKEKKPYLDKVAELKAEYEKAMESYNAAEAEGEEGGEAEGEEGGEEEGEHEEGADDKSDKEEAAAGEDEELTDEE
ncbi:hypothetical protein PIB30_117924 [Stylosanthes scabra]|nr:hypothetical protein [Stylosanthes scabra]